MHCFHSVPPTNLLLDNVTFMTEEKSPGAADTPKWSQTPEEFYCDFL